MNQNKSGTEQRIVEAAVQLFSRQGFNGTSTREIARLADINEATLFRHFPRKQEIFWAAVHSRLSRLRLGKELEAGLAADGEPEKVVPLIIEFLVHTATFQPELIRLLQVSLLDLRPRAELVFRERLGPIFEAFSGYLGRRIASGALRPMDPTMLAISFGTTVLAHHSLSKLLTDDGTQYGSTGEAVLAYSHFWLSALAPGADFETPARSVASAANNG